LNLVFCWIDVGEAQDRLTEAGHNTWSQGRGADVGSIEGLPAPIIGDVKMETIV
jgi:hypothetical protein